MIYHFSSPFVFCKKIDNHEEIKERYLKYIESDIEKNKEKYIISDWDCNVYSSFNQENSFLTTFFDKSFWNIFDECLSLSNLKRVPLNTKVLKCWYNYYYPGFYQEAHTHSGSTFSGIYLLKLNEENTTVFLNPGDQEFNYDRFDTKNLEEGTLIIFPSNLLHYVGPCKKERITISFNMYTTFK